MQKPGLMQPNFSHSMTLRGCWRSSVDLVVLIHQICDCFSRNKQIGHHREKNLRPQKRQASSWAVLLSVRVGPLRGSSTRELTRAFVGSRVLL